jgi:hypothetical protein
MTPVTRSHLTPPANTALAYWLSSTTSEHTFHRRHFRLLSFHTFLSKSQLTAHVKSKERNKRRKSEVTWKASLDGRPHHGALFDYIVSILFMIICYYLPCLLRYEYVCVCIRIISSEVQCLSHVRSGDERKQEHIHRETARACCRVSLYKVKDDHVVAGSSEKRRAVARAVGL